MSTHSLEIVVPDGTARAVSRQLGSLGRAKVVVEPSQAGRRRHICLALAGTLERGDTDSVSWVRSMRERLGDVPFVVLWHEGESRGTDWRIAQRLVRIASGAHGSTYVAPDAAAARRLALAQAQGAERLLIASAEIVEDALEVWSCEPKLYRVPVAMLPALRPLREEELRDIEISTSGSRIRWPEHDIDLNLDVLRAAVDPLVMREHRATYAREASHYGNAIRALREGHGLRQTDIPGITSRTIRRLERGEVLPQSDTLRKLADAHGLTVADYMGELARSS